VTDLRILDSVGMTKHGTFALAQDEVDIAATAKAQEGAAGRLSEFYDLLHTEEGDWQIGPKDDKANQSFYALTKAQELAVNTNLKGRLLGTTIDDPWAYNEAPGGATAKVPGPKPEQPMQGPKRDIFPLGTAIKQVVIPPTAEFLQGAAAARIEQLRGQAAQRFPVGRP
jgi:hypothetical protein